MTSQNGFQGPLVTTIQVGHDGPNNPQQGRQQQQLLRSAFIPEEEDGKQFISKDESELLRDSILRVNRPRINRPWFDQPPAGSTTRVMIKKNSASTARSNSSSGCSSNPQSGPSSPVSSKCSSEGGAREQQQQQQQQTIQIAQTAAAGAHERPPLDMGQKGDRPIQMLSASLVRKAVPSTSSNAPVPEQPSISTVSSSSSAKAAPPLAAIHLPSLLKRKEFPSYQRQRVLMPAQKVAPPAATATRQKQTPQQQSPKQKQPSTGFAALRRMDPAEEVEELSRAARKQMAILENLEVEDSERKKRISSHLARQSAGAETVVSSAGASPASSSSRESTATRSPASASPLVARHGSSSHRSSSSFGDSGEDLIRAGLQRLLVEDLSRRIGLTSSEKRAVEEEEWRKKAEDEHSTTSTAAKGVLVPQAECRACGGAIVDVILQALGCSFHPRCFRCSRCDKCLDGVPFAVEQGGAVICMEDYERHFVPHCHACGKPINSVNEFGQVVRVILKDREYHIDCYCCEGCGMQLSNEQCSRCYPLGEHLLCRRCHTLWRRMGPPDCAAAISDL